MAYIGMQYGLYRIPKALWLHSGKGTYSLCFCNCLIVSVSCSNEKTLFFGPYTTKDGFVMYDEVFCRNNS